MSTKSNILNTDSNARANDVNTHTQDSNARAKNTSAHSQDSNARAKNINVRMQGVTSRAQDSNARAQGPNGRFKKVSRNKPTWDQINQQLSRKAFKKGCAQGWNVQPGKAGLNSRAQKGMGPNKASGHKGGISRQGSKRG